MQLQLWAFSWFPFKLDLGMWEMATNGNISMCRGGDSAYWNSCGWNQEGGKGREHRGRTRRARKLGLSHLVKGQTWNCLSPSVPDITVTVYMTQYCSLLWPYWQHQGSKRSKSRGVLFPLDQDSSSKRTDWKHALATCPLAVQAAM